MAVGGRRFGRFGRFLVVGVSSVAVDAGLLVVLYDGVGVPLGVATTLAFLGALAVNFSLNLRWVFGAHHRLARRLLRYGVLVALNYGITLAVVVGLSAVGLYYVLAKLLAVGVCVLLNFAAYRSWVFS